MIWEEVNLNHLLLMDDMKACTKIDAERDSLIQSERIFSNDIKVELGLSENILQLWWDKRRIFDKC